MRIILHIGMPQTGAGRVQKALADIRDDLLTQGVLVPDGTGSDFGERLLLAVADPDHLGPLQATGGFPDPERQGRIRRQLADDLAAATDRHRPETMILACDHLGAHLHRPSELERLRALLSPFSDDIRIVAHVEEQARLLVRHYAGQILAGRDTSLELELALAEQDNWWEACLDASCGTDPARGRYFPMQAAPFWLDYAALVRAWESVFGAGTVDLRPGDPAEFNRDTVMTELDSAFGIAGAILPDARTRSAPQPAATWLTRARLFNALILKAMASGRLEVPPQLWRQCVHSLRIGGDPISPGSLAVLSDRFWTINAELMETFPALATATLVPAPPETPWAEADPGNGYRASQYLLAFLPRLERIRPQDRNTGDGTPPASLPDATAAEPVSLQPGGTGTAAAQGDRHPEQHDGLTLCAAQPHRNG